MTTRQQRFTMTVELHENDAQNRWKHTKMLKRLGKGHDLTRTRWFRRRAAAGNR